LQVFIFPIYNRFFCTKCEAASKANSAFGRCDNFKRKHATWHLDCVIFEEEFLKYAASVPWFIILFLCGRSTFLVAAAVKFVVLVQ